MVRKVKPWVPYLEGTVFVGLIALVNFYILNENPAFKDSPFSLLWLPIIFISGRYGTIPAVFTSILCGAFYFFQVSLENFFFGKFELESRDKTVLFAFVFIGAILGQMHDRIMNQLISLHGSHEDLKTQFKNLHLHYESMEAANVELERRIVGRYTTLSSLYEMARNLESLDEQHLFRGVLELVHRFLQADKMCIFHLQESAVLRLADAFGFQESEKSELSKFAAQSKLVKMALKGEDVVSFRELAEEKNDILLGQQILLSAPIILPANKKKVGVIAIFQMPFLAIHSSNVRIFHIIADWTGRALEKSKAFADLRARELDSQLTGVYTFSYFTIRISEELSRACRNKLPLSIILIHLKDFDQINSESQESLLVALGLVFYNTLRDVDLPCRYSTSATFAFILPLSENSGANVLLEKLRKSIEMYEFKPFSDDRQLEVKGISHSFVPDSSSRTIFKIEKSVVEKFLGDAERKLYSN